jgi:D-glycero-D-manno-heptose 1,7-bisphosphate phosphatase
MKRRAVFVDRDGTLNVRPREHEYVTAERDFTWLPGAATGLARLAHAGYVLAVVSNQRGVARGLVRLQALHAIEAKIQRDLARYGCEITAFRYCTHGDEDGCECRKPRPGMILDLVRELDIDLAGSWVIGDSESDVRAGEAAGCGTVLIGESDHDVRPDLKARCLAEASDLLTLPSGSAAIREIQRAAAPASESKVSTSAW